MGSERLVDVMPDLFKSPIVTEFRWSPLIEGILRQNFEHFAPDGLPYSSLDNNPYPTIEGLLVMHLRRGDFGGELPAPLLDRGSLAGAHPDERQVRARLVALVRGPGA